MIWAAPPSWIDCRRMAESPRIVSLIASATEIVCGLGLREHLVGISHECDYPPDVAGLPVLSAPKVNPALASAEIDRRVREIVREGLSVYRVDVGGLERLRPDLIVTQDHCEVCAVSLRDVEDALCAITHTATTVCSLHPSSLADIARDFQRVAEAAGVPERGGELAGAFRSRLDAVRERTAGAVRRPRVACLEWLEPPMAAGGWMPELVRIAGGEPVLVETAEAFRTVRWSDVRAADPDVVVILPCGYSLARTRSDIEQGAVNVELRALRAVREGACWVTDGNAYFNRPGPRIADSAELLAGMIQRERCGEWLTQHRGAAARWP